MLKVPKGPKIPFKVMVGMQAKKKQRAQKKEQLEKEQGIYVAKDDDHKTSLEPVEYFNQLKGNRRGGHVHGSVLDGSRGLKSSAGRFKQGVLYVNPRSVQQGNSTNTNRNRRNDRPASSGFQKKRKLGASRNKKHKQKKRKHF